MRTDKTKQKAHLNIWKNYKIKSVYGLGLNCKVRIFDATRMKTRLIQQQGLRTKKNEIGHLQL